jgi:hypothetical protein
LALATLGFLAALGTALPARAEVVRLMTGENLFGQGWRFLDTDGVCKVATARHVVVGADGALLPVVVRDSHKREAPAEAPVFLSDDPTIDAAVVSVPSQNDPLLCGDGRLSAIGVDRRARADSGLLLETTGQSEVVTVPVIARAARVDAHGGEVFAVAPEKADDKFAKGWSGSVVRDSLGPVGIVFDVDPERNEANAVRIDAVRKLIKKPSAGKTAQTGDAASAASASISSVAGVTTDPLQGPDKIFAAANAGWLVTPTRRAIGFVVVFAAPRAMHTVQLSFDKTKDTGLKGIEVRTSASAAGDDWVSMGYCPAKDDPKTLSCTILNATVRRVQVIAKADGDDPVVIYRWKVE